MASRVLRFPLTAPPNHPFTGPGGPAEHARGEFRLRLWPDGTGAALSRVEGLRLANNGGGFYQTWLVADLRVPRRLKPEDLARLPRKHPEANRPGSIFTLDGESPRPLGPSAQEPPNTVWIAVRAGAWGTDETGRQPGARWYLNDFSNWTFWLPEAWGAPPPAGTDDPSMLRDPDHPGLDAVRGLPSRLALNLLTDLYIRGASILPEIPPDPALPRLEGLWRRYVPILDRDGDGLLSYRDAVGIPELFLDPLAFERVIVTREVPSAATAPRCYPTTAAVVLAGWREDLAPAGQREDAGPAEDHGRAGGDSAPLTEPAVSG